MAAAGTSAEGEDDVLRARVHPRFLKSNSTSHKWPFGAIAELVDNACDPDVLATSFDIEYEYVLSSGEHVLTLTDNGRGASPRTIYKMLSFGYCEKAKYMGQEIPPIGAYGNGFKSGSMRLGDDVIVLSRKSHRNTVGMLSQSMLKALNYPEVIVPLASWDFRFRELKFGVERDVDLIYEHSPFKTLTALREQFQMIKGQSGTRIIVYNLRRQVNTRGVEQLELDFESDEHDVRLRGVDEGDTFSRTRINQPLDTSNPLDFSLRAYLEVLYLRPRMRITLRGERVRTRLLRHALAHASDDIFRYGKGPDAGEAVITFGVSPVPNFYGMMLYHHNRLIKVCERVGIQLESNAEGEGIIGIMEANFLEPTHNKQDFNETPQYRSLLKTLARKLKAYWEFQREDLEREDDVCTWVQCLECLKWRNLGVVGSKTQLESLEEADWLCADMNKSCEDPEDNEDDQSALLKRARADVKKRRETKRKREQEKRSRSSLLQESVREVLSAKKKVGVKRGRDEAAQEAKEEEEETEEEEGEEGAEEGAGTPKKKRTGKRQRTGGSSADRLSDEDRVARLQRVITALLPPHVHLAQDLTWEFLDSVDVDDWVHRIQQDKSKWEQDVREAAVAELEADV